MAIKTGWVSKKVYAILASSGEEGRKIIDKLGEASQEEVNRDLDNFFKNHKRASIDAFDDDSDPADFEFDGDYNDVFDEESQQVYDFLNNAAKNEPAITKKLQEIGCNLKGLEYRLKSDESLYRKVKTELYEQDQKTFSEILNSTKDAVRYTTLVEPDQLASHVKEICDKLIQSGYKMTKFKNNFGRNDYRDINTNFISPDGQIFELQFNTPDGFETKEKFSHPIYEEIRKLKDGDPRIQSLQQKLVDVWKNVKVPNNITEVRYAI